VPRILDDSTYRKLSSDPEHVVLDAMQPLALGLTPRNEISRLTLPQLQRVGYCGFCYFVSFCWIVVVTPQNKLNGLGVLNPVTYARQDVRTEG
jgi:hypothetical protein